ncbi:sulfatase-like hydrolase/transferase [Amycolatopsis sp. YIM 10]|uniref:sulfatase-like hydrolase/transferase n=1 Tax=Amycolatopsis sp. YIM 10 TaxID=2653857 RepID=UPI0012AA7E3C|nr:Sulfatase [Amycolatopsis sp. YIM 10]
MSEETESTARPVRRALARAGLVLAALLVFAALVVPDELDRLSPGAFARLPVEALAGVALVLVLPVRPRRVLAALAGAVLGLLTIVKLINMGFRVALDRPFNPVFDWDLFGPAIDLLTTSIGEAGAIAAVCGIVLVALVLVVLLALSAVRLARLVAGHRTTSTRVVSVLGVVWIACAVLGVQFVPGEPVAANSAVAFAYEDLRKVRADLLDQDAFAAESGAPDPFAAVPGDQLLTALRGKDVVFTFVESYGRFAVHGSDVAARIGPLLDQGTERLRAAGFGARSAYLTSPTTGGGSWLAHSTLQSGLEVKNEQRYDTVLASDRLTLGGAFQRAGWRTVGDVPAHTRDWPEGAFYGYDGYYDARNVGYQGPSASYVTMPDQFTLSAFHRNERAVPGHQPVMAEIDLVSSHFPWAPPPPVLDWNAVGDGSVYHSLGRPPVEGMWSDPALIRGAYAETVEYSLATLLSYVETHGGDDLVLVFLGDHQPSTMVTGEGADWDVPVTIVARDPAVLDRAAGWGWDEGLRPGPHAPVKPMQDFRDQFLTAYAR